MADRASRRRALLEGGVLAGILFVAHIVVNVAWALFSGLPVLHLGAAVMSAVIGWWPMLLAFLVVTLLIALTGWSRVTRFRLAVPTAIIAWLLGQTAVALVAGRPLPDAVLWGVFGLPLFLAVAFVAGMVAGPVVVAVLPEPSGSALAPDGPAGAGESSLPPRPPAEPRDDRPGPPAVAIVRAVAFGVAILLTLSLPWQWFRVYFRFPGGSEPVVTAAQGVPYLVTVLVALGLLVLAGVLARRQGRRLTGTIAAIAVVVLVAFVCQVPAGTIWVDPGVPIDSGPAPGEPGGGITEDCAYDANRPGCGG